MSVATELPSSVKPIPETRRVILGPTGNRVRVSEESKWKIEGLKKPKPKPKPKPQKQSRLVSKNSQSVVRSNLSVESSCSSDSSSCGSSVKAVVSSKRRVRQNGLKSLKVAPESVEIPLKRCDWITLNSDPLYISFHDEEWGVPVHDDRKLFELLILSQALAELTWPAILNKKDIFRKLFDNFDPSLIANWDEKKVLSLRANGSTFLSEPKLRAIVENANQMLKVQQEFGSFSSYFWNFVNKKPIRNGFRYTRQVPAKTPKAELISKDLMQRGFRCVGPTVVYSFMQVAGIVNDHLTSCFRYEECNRCVEKDLKPKTDDSEVQTKDVENKTVSSHA